MAKLQIDRAIKWWAEKDGDRPALTCDGRTITRRELIERTDRLACAFARMGVAQKKFVVIALPNGSPFFETALAAVKLGAMVLPISSRMPPRERAPILDAVKPALIVGLPSGSYKDVPTVPESYSCPDDLVCEGLPGVAPYAWFTTTSGGSTGSPKLIVNTQAGLTDPQIPLDRLTLEGTLLIPGPLYHGAPFNLGLRGLSFGDHVIIMPKFDPEGCLRLIDQYRVDYVQVVPTMMNRIWRLGPEVLGRYDLSSLRVLVSFGAACPGWLKEAWIGLIGAEHVHEFYSATEQIGKTWISGTEWLQHRGSVGRPVNGSRIKIFGRDGREMPTGKMGDIYLTPATGPGSTYYYIGAESQRRPDGWETSGDLGWLDEDGYLYIADRRTDLIVSGGANVYPAEIETLIDQYPGVRASVVIGLPDDDLGHRVHAIVEADQSLGVEELRAWLAERLVRYKIPRTFEIVNDPIRNEAGKVRRSAYRRARTGN
jgi:bile acid-coenzyme A ligase